MRNLLRLRAVAMIAGGLRGNAPATTPMPPQPFTQFQVFPAIEPEARVQTGRKRSKQVRGVGWPHLRWRK